MSTSCNQRPAVAIPRQRGDRPAQHRAAEPPVSLLRRAAERYLMGVAEAAGAVTVAAVTYAVLVLVLL